MKAKLSLFVVSILLLTISGSVFGAAYTSALTTSVTYQNVGDQEAQVTFTFYAENNGTGVDVDQTVPAGAGASLFVGGLNEVAPGFNGSAVMSSNQPIVATLVQIAADTAVKNRPLSNGFSSGSSTVLLPTVLKNQFSTTSRFSIQNVSSGNVDLTIEIFNASAPTDPPVVVTHNNLPSGAAQYFDMGTLPQITAASFNGSATVTATASGSATPADIVGTVLEASTTGNEISAFEGVSGGSTTVYMATGLCSAFGASTAYAVQNVGGAATNVTVTYSGGETDVANIAPGAKNSFLACDALAAGTSSAAVVTASEPVVVIGKVFGSGNSTAWVGASQGADNIALPYVRFTVADWASGAKQRGYLAIQNVGGALAAGDVVLSYRDKDGNEVGVHTLGALANGQKANSHAIHPDVVGNAADLEEFGYIGGFGGGVVITAPAGSELVALVRIQSNVGGGAVVGEDATGIPIGGN